MAEIEVEVEVTVLPGGQMEVSVDGEGVTFEQAREITLRLLAYLRANKLQVEMAGEVEQHRAGVQHVHVRGRVQARGEVHVHQHEH